MHDYILNLDLRLFYFINHDLANPVFDVLMPVFRNKFTWIPVYALIVWQLIRQFKKRGALAIVLLLLCFAATDQLSAGIIKKQVKRMRPCNQPALEKYVQERVDCGTGLSFPSSHAANHFAVSVFLSVLFYRRWKPVLPLSLFWAALVCFAQVYVGVHFPVDVLCGALIGACTGTVFALIFNRTARYIR